MILTLSIIFAFQCSDNIWNLYNAYTDSSVFRYVARVILDGGMPYKDTFDHKGPLIYLINALGLLISKKIGVWILEFITIFLAFGFMYKIARLFCGKGISAMILWLCSSALFKYFEGGNLTEEYALPFITISIYIFTDYFLNRKINIFRLLVSGFCFGAVCMLRINMVAVWLVMCFGVIVDTILKKKYEQLGKFILFFSIGVGIICVPILTWLNINDSFGYFIKDYFIFNIKYSSEMGEGLKMAMKVQTFIHFMKESLVLFAISICAYLAVKKRNYFDILYTIFLLLNLMLLSISGKQYMHYGMTLVPALPYPFARIIGAGFTENNDEKHIFVLGLTYLLVIFGVPNWLDGINNVFQIYSTRNEVHVEQLEEKIATLVKENTTEEEQIIVCGSWNIIYNLAERFAASKYSYQNIPCSVDEDNKNEFLQELEENRPKLVVVKEDAYVYKDVMSLIEKYNYQKIYGDKEEGIQVYKLSTIEAN